MERDLVSGAGECSLHDAIELLDVERVRRIVGRGADIEGMDRHGNTPLVKAVQVDSLDIVDLLLHLGADVNAPVFVSGRETTVFKVSMKRTLSFAILCVSTGVAPYAELTPVRHQIIKRLIAAGAELDVVEQFQDMYISPLQNACNARLWPVVVDLIEAESIVDVKGHNREMPLMTAFSVADRSGLFEDTFEDEDWSLVSPSKSKALDLLLEKSPTLRLVTSRGSLFRQVIDGCSARVLCTLLKVDKPAYGIDEAADLLEPGARIYIFDILKRNHITLDFEKFRFGLRCCPLEFSIMYLLRCFYYTFSDAMQTLRYIRRQFAVLRLLLDARANVCRLDENFKRFLHIIRDQLNSTHFPEDTLAFCNQILDEIEAKLYTPRKLAEICRARIRHELNIRGLCVHHIKDSVNLIVENYLLDGDLPQPEQYLEYKYR